MRRKLTCLPLVIVAVTVAALYYAESARATAPSGFTGTTLAKATFAEFQVFNQFTQNQLQQLAPGFAGETWFSFEKTQGPSDLYVQSNTWQPGGTAGWHTHPGHTLIIVTSGQITQYHADCTPQVYGPGTTLIDTGKEAHVIRNEGSVSAMSVAVQLIPKGAPRRIDEKVAPSTCQIDTQPLN